MGDVFRSIRGLPMSAICPLKMREIIGARLTEPGRDSPFRERSRDENRDLFERMRRGEFAEGERVLSAKIDMGARAI